MRRTLVNASDRPEQGEDRRQRLAVVAFGLAFGLFVLLLLTVMINIRGQSDFPREAWEPYRLLFHGHITGFLKTGPAYIGSLILRAPFALVAHALGAGARATYIATALPCVAAPALLAGWLATERPAPRDGHARRLWPLDLFVITPASIFCITVGHPEDMLGAVLCVAAVLLAQRGSARAAAAMLALALINKSWAVIVLPLVVVLLPANKRLAALTVVTLVTAFIMVPIEAIRVTGSGTIGAGLGTTVGNHPLIPELLWVFGPNSWVVGAGHVIVVLGGWAATGAWWWRRVKDAGRQPTAGEAMLILALVFFLRAALDPWDNLYYFTPFMLALMVYEDGAGGFPKLSWAFAIMLVIVIPPVGLLARLGDSGHALAFAVWALAVIAYLARRVLSGGRPAMAPVYTALSRSSA